MQETWMDPEEMSFRQSSSGCSEQGAPKASASALVKATICLMKAYCSALGLLRVGFWRVIWKMMFWVVTHSKPMSVCVQLQELHLATSSMQVRQLAAQGRHWPQSWAESSRARKQPGLQEKQKEKSWQVRQLAEQGRQLFSRRQQPAAQMAHLLASVSHLRQQGCSWQVLQTPVQRSRQYPTGQMVQLLSALQETSGQQLISSASRQPSKQEEQMRALKGEHSRQGKLQSSQQRLPTSRWPQRQVEQTELLWQATQADGQIWHCPPATWKEPTGHEMQVVMSTGLQEQHPSAHRAHVVLLTRAYPLRQLFSSHPPLPARSHRPQLAAQGRQDPLTAVKPEEQARQEAVLLGQLRQL